MEILNPGILVLLQILSCSLILISAQSQDLKCYKCVSQAGDNTCLEDPERVPITPNFEDCEGGWCTTTRKEFTDIPGKIVHFTRDCAKKRPEFTDHIIHNAHYTTYYTTCRTVRCNSGDGLKENSGGEDGGDITGLIIVHGEVSGAAAQSVKFSASLGLFSAMISLLIFRYC